MLLTNRFSRLVAIAVVATVAVAAIITFAFSTEAVGGNDSRERADDARPSVSAQPTAEDSGPTAVGAEAMPTTDSAAQDPTADPEPTSTPAANGSGTGTGTGTGQSSSGGTDRPTPAPATPSPTAAPTTPPAPSPPAPTTPPRQCNLLEALLGGCS